MLEGIIFYCHQVTVNLTLKKHKYIESNSTFTFLSLHCLATIFSSVAHISATTSFNFAPFPFFQLMQCWCHWWWCRIGTGGKPCWAFYPYNML